MLRVLALPALLCVATTACFNPPDTPLTGESTTTDVGTTTTGIDSTLTDSSSSSVGPTTEVDPDTTVSPPETSTTDTGDTTTGGGGEIEVSVDGRVIDAGGSFDLVDTVGVGELGSEVTFTVANVGEADLLVDGVVAMGPDAAQIVLDQAGLAATIAAGDSSTFTATFAPTNGGLKTVVLSIGNDDADESPYDIGFSGHTTPNMYRLIPAMGAGPTGRFNAAIEDLGDGRLLLFGGRNAGGVWLDDTWIFELETSMWTQVPPAMAPPPRNAHDMALVAAGTVVMFGGTAATAGGPLGDTWIFDVATEQWSQFGAPMSPPPRFQHGMIAIGDSRVLLHGGRSAPGGELGDTWIFDGATGTWTNAMPAGAPMPDTAFAFAFDRMDTVTRFGGFANNTTLLDQTWSYTVSTNTWAMEAPMGSPGNRAVLSGEYLSFGQMIVFSGKLDDCCIDPVGGTFAYDPAANTWTTITPSAEPSPRFSYAMTAVEGGNKAILFGGLLQNTGVGTALAETWEYVGPRP
jgi:hypothetical protein